MDVSLEVSICRGANIISGCCSLLKALTYIPDGRSRMSTDAVSELFLLRAPLPLAQAVACRGVAGDEETFDLPCGGMGWGRAGRGGDPLIPDCISLQMGISAGIAFLVRILVLPAHDRRQ